MILSLDSGLDCVGWALFTAPGQPLATLQAHAPYLLASGYVTTKPDSRPDHIQIPARVTLLVSSLAAAVWRTTPLDDKLDTAIIEVPSAFGPYASRGPDRRQKALGMARSMACLWYTIGRLEGWLAATYPPIRIISLKAAGQKAANHAMVRVVWSHLPTVKTGPGADQLDAVYLGLRYLLDRRRGGT